MTMRSRARNQQSIDSPLWTKRLFSFLKSENIKIVKRVIVSVVGATVLLIGIALLVLPGPAFVVIPVGSPSLQPSTRGRDAGSKKLVEFRVTSFLAATAEHRENLVFSFAPAGVSG
jgi:hypothetical protein